MKKIIWLTMVSMVVLLGACSSGGKETSNDSKKEGIQSIQDSGKLVVGTSADFAPFEFHTMIDGKDQIVGVDIDLANEIAKELGVKVEVMDMEFNAVLAALQQGKVNLAISGISATEERQQTFDFSDNYFAPPQKMVINKENANELTSLKSFAKKKVGAQKGSVQEDVVKEQVPDAQLVSVAKVPNLIIELKQGSIDGLVLEETVANSYIENNPELMLADVDLVSSDEEAYAIALPKGEEDLQKKVNQVIKELQSSGKMDEFIKKNTELAKKAEE
ncbi:transporter substrate-binding domain-containing protein [Enterococcus thailandicus]|uniref:Amino acid ABC transporter substrate-binding protein n=1 Tax=Enterococcus thailandicus TaxID=417368 RepID=A0A179EVV5_ENTTH|nr:transporter substrate-binding domain-containing protein [Enterococcus thailandicus]ASZ07879.1 amino acid ABC transporter substrate-binding protein [Enterococcus thailandicus]MDA3964024.1 transporter substrate-binding domain-containing protein [Enterococcus thailandicus]MDT2752882.1 transporter substrate-binding domain-containing protein [Enterococcus thailandicus]MDT2774909.1 transporter substrate-binding domain-containing protein [Enterococcus thailandicus]MDT2793405.1 transporter substrat